MTIQRNDNSIREQRIGTCRIFNPMAIRLNEINLAIDKAMEKQKTARIAIRALLDKQKGEQK